MIVSTGGGDHFVSLWVGCGHVQVAGTYELAAAADGGDSFIGSWLSIFIFGNNWRDWDLIFAIKGQLFQGLAYLPEDSQSRIHSWCLSLGFNSMEILHFEEDHQVKGSDKWIVGQVDSRKSKLDGVRRPKSGIVLTKKGVIAGDALVQSHEEGVMDVRPMQPMVAVGDRSKGNVVTFSKATNSKRTHN
ncbi:hypothetical protein V6N13_001602 [Hibiscus sabdariffa]